MTSPLDLMLDHCNSNSSKRYCGEVEKLLTGMVCESLVDNSVDFFSDLSENPVNTAVYTLLLITLVVSWPVLHALMKEVLSSAKLDLLIHRYARNAFFALNLEKSP